MWKHLLQAAAFACVPAILVTSAHAALRCGGGSFQDPDEMQRHDTSKQRLQIQWQAYVPRTGSEKFDPAAAVRELRGQNPKPIFLLRDCDSCTGKDDTFVEKSLQDEKVTLASRWFHCVRVDRGAIKDTHPLNSLFTGTKPPHIILISTNGNDRTDLDGRNARVLFEAICQTLRKDYKKSPDAAMTSWIALLSRFDSLDAKKAELVSKRQLITDARKATDIDKKLMDVDRDLAKALEEEKKITDLELRPPPVAPGAPVDNDAAAAEAVTKAKAKPSLLDRIKKDQEKKDQDKKEPEKKEPEPGTEKK